MQEDTTPQEPQSRKLITPEEVRAYIEEEIKRHDWKVAAYTRSINSHDEVLKKAPDDLARTTTRCMTEMLKCRRSEHELVRDVLKDILACEDERARITSLAAIEVLAKTMCI